MTGPEHYREAENLLAMASEQVMGIATGDPTAGEPDGPALLVAEAQVHATLALAAASAEAVVPYSRYKPWAEVTR